MAAQASREQRRAVADVVVDNDVPLPQLERRVRELWDDLVERARRTAAPAAE
jgi:dephospho-CoA kinase